MVHETEIVIDVNTKTKDKRLTPERFFGIKFTYTNPEKNNCFPYNIFTGLDDPIKIEIIELVPVYKKSFEALFVGDCLIQFHKWNDESIVCSCQNKSLLESVCHVNKHNYTEFKINEKEDYCTLLTDFLKINFSYLEAKNRYPYKDFPSVLAAGKKMKLIKEISKQLNKKHLKITPKRGHVQKDTVFFNIKECDALDDLLRLVNL